MKLSQKAKLLVLLISGVFLFSCADKANNTDKKSNTDTTTIPTEPTPVEPSMQIERPEHVEITPPTAGIPGKAPGVALPGTEDWRKGVFVEGRNPVKISPYAIAKTEVTYKLWKEVYDWNTANSKGYNFVAGRKGSKNDNSGNELEPVTKVSWNDAIVFCNAYTEMKSGNLDEAVYWDKDPKTNSDAKVLKNSSATDVLKNTYMDKSKTGFRLPTEAEWELAARLQADGSLLPLDRASGASADYNDAEANNAVAWYSVNSNNKTQQVGQKKANAMVLYDMSGNVWEWCFDYYNSDAKSADAEQNPVLDPAGPSIGYSRVFRGGSWYDYARYLLVGSRNHYVAGDTYSYVGLRLAWGVRVH